MQDGEPHAFGRAAEGPHRVSGCQLPSAFAQCWGETGVLSRGERREDIFHDDRLLAYPWSSLGWYVSAPEQRPQWMRVDGLLGEHRIGADTAAGRAEFERRMESRRAQANGGEEWAAVRAGWCLGSEAFRKELLGRMDGRLGDRHAGELRRESAEARTDRIITEELGRLGWSPEELRERRKHDPDKLRIAVRL